MFTRSDWSRAASSSGTLALGSEGNCWLMLFRLKKSVSLPSRRSTCTACASPPRLTVERMVSPVTANGWSKRRTLAATRARTSTGFVSTLVTREARLHSGLCTRVSAEPNTATPLVCSRLDAVAAARLTLNTDDGTPACTVPAEPASSAQSCCRMVVPSRHLRAPVSTRFSLPLPATRAAMQKGMHVAVLRQASSLFPEPPPTSCPHRGISHTTASSSLQVPLAMQSAVGSVVLSEAEPRLAVAVSYRVYDHRTDLTYRSTPAHVYRWAASVVGKSTCRE